MALAISSTDRISCSNTMLKAFSFDITVNVKYKVQWRKFTLRQWEFSNNSPKLGNVISHCLKKLVMLTMNEINLSFHN